LPTQEKIEAIAELKDKLENAQIIVLSKYTGINADQVTNLRRQLRDKNVDYKVYKNTLAMRALDEAGLSDLARFIDGPTAWAFSDDPVSPPKIFKDFNKDVPVVEMTGGILEGKVVDKSELDKIADLPSYEELIGKTVNVLAAPLQNLLGVLNANPRNLVNVLEQIRKQKEEQGES